MSTGDREAATRPPRLLWPGLIALLLLAGCDRTPDIPAPDEVAAVDESVRARVHSHSDRIEQSGYAFERAALDRTLASIRAQHGEDSMAMVQALTDAGVMLATEISDHQAAVPFFRAALETAERVYGHEHRETAFSLHDYGEIQMRASGFGYVPAATPLYEEALAVRQRVLGARHPETAASGMSLAEQLLRACQAQTPCRPDDARLARASGLSRHAVDVFRLEGRDRPVDAEEADRLAKRIEALRGAVLRR